MEKDKYSAKKKLKKRERKMYKELIISLIVIVSIISLDRVTNNYLKESTNVLTQKLSTLKQQEEPKEEKLAYYIEHNELEKVKTKMINAKSNIETEDKEQKVQSIDEAIYLLEHIRDKDTLNLKDIF